MHQLKKITHSFSSYRTKLVPLTFCFFVTISSLILMQRSAIAAPVSGKYFGTITIEVNQIFDPPDNKLYKIANALKRTTRKLVVQRELLFKTGDAYDPFLVSESERVLRSLGFLRDITISEVHENSLVNIFVSVQDTWTIIPQISLSGGDGRTKQSAGISEANLLGWGKRIEAVSYTHLTLPTICSV